ncbi:polyol transporter 5-like [Magnolia sinica]|uniref:polyol transporter 5-like n=1 Tax=Magnolia sinica TaxID=86752 RepID=UPI0026582DD1|nr:polyol transporter 5-like [Magnolia sinica]
MEIERQGRDMAAEERGQEAVEANAREQKVGIIRIWNTTHLNKYVLAGAVLASMNSILLGYDIGVMSGAVLFIKDDLGITSTQEEILIGSLNACSLLGSLAAGKTSDWIGRRYTIVLASATFLIGSLLMGLAPCFPFLMVGRIVAGIGVGYSLMIAPVYTAEISPATTRGFLTSLPEVFINIGILLGYIFNYAFVGLPQNLNWRLMLGVAAIPAIFVAIGVLAMPESPRWLVMRGRSEEARQVLLKTSSDEGEAELRFLEITEAAAAASNTSTTNDKNMDTWQRKGVWKELLLTPTRPVRRVLIAAIGLNFFMQASGNDAVVYYCPEVFKAAGIHKKKELVGVTIAMGFVKTFFVLLSACFLDRFGRRPLLLLGSTGVAASITVLGIGSKVLEASERKSKWAIVLSVISVCAYVSFFSIGLGPITWVYSSEIFPMRLRAQGSSIAISVNRIVSGMVAMTFLSISKAISFGYTFFIFGAISLLGAIFFYVFLPETKGKSLEEMGVLFEDKSRENSSREK